jgi:hypothetical protein
MNLQVLQDAEDELNEAIGDYEEKESGLGLRLKEEVRDVIKWIRHNFDVPRLRPKGYRRVNLRVFPYYVAYFTWADTIWILAIAHGYRRPEYWIGRKSKIT